MSNQFGNIFRITTFGESHGKAMGVVIEGCPANIFLCIEDIQKKLFLRTTGKFLYTSQRKSLDRIEILSGVFQGKTTGMPIAILIYNGFSSSTDKKTKDLLLPGHAKLSYLNKYGIFDFWGHGRASARETVARVAAACIAEKILAKQKIFVKASLCQVGPVEEEISFQNKKEQKNPFSFWSEDKKKEALTFLKMIEKEKDSIGGAVSFETTPNLENLGEPVFDKLCAKIAYALMSIPGAKAVEFGMGVLSAKAKGSEFHDAFDLSPDKKIKKLKTNRCGGTLGGIALAMPIYGKVSFKPTPTSERAKETLSLKTCEKMLYPANKSKNFDLCIALRAAPIVQAMIELTLVDLLFIHKARQ